MRVAFVPLTRPSADLSPGGEVKKTALPAQQGHESRLSLSSLRREGWDEGTCETVLADKSRKNLAGLSVSDSH